MAALFIPKRDIPAHLSLAIGVLAGLTLLAIWCLLSYGGFVDPDFLATPGAVLAAGKAGIEDGSLPANIGSSLTVILEGFFLASLFAVPLGVVMGSYRVVQAALEPVTNFMRYLPVSALIPLLMLWLGIGQVERVAIIFLGTFFQQLILIADVSARVSKDLLDVSYTLGAKPRHALFRVLFPACLPGIMDNLRVTMGWAWTYLVVAELVAADSGLGYMILNAMRGLYTDVILLGVFTIGILGLITDQLFAAARRILLPWASQ